LETSQYKLMLFSAIFFTLFYNFSFFKNVVNTYGFSGFNIVHILSTAVLLVSLMTFLGSIFASKYTTKAILVILFTISSFTAYFMDSYGVVIDTEMIRNTMQTNLDESMDLFSFRLILYVIFLALIPSYIILYKVKIEYKSFKKELFSKLKATILSLLIVLLILISFSKFYTSFFREYKSLRYEVNPVYWVYSIGNYIHQTFDVVSTTLQEIARDAKVIEPIHEPKELVILVIGEAARADRFSINGYEKKINPLLEKEDIISFSNMYSCGTSTAHSVPCIFSVYTREEYSYKKAISTENILDILKNTEDVSILWRDNNSDSKGVALRIEYEDFRTPKTNSICDEECRDEGMLVGLEDYIANNKGKDILIILHQMGSHGPAYYKRYPKEFEKFTPVCKTNQLENCTKEEIGNAYDNTILYTDYFLSKAINLLKKYKNTHETALIYMSDHGESLGENGIYLHGIPYVVAPKEQKHIASFIYLGKGAMEHEYDKEKLRTYKDNRFSQDNLFHTLLGLFEIQTKLYEKDKDILHDARNPE